MRFIQYILNILFIIISLSVFSQVKSSALIEGKITEPDGKPIEAASISVFGTSTGTSSNRLGEYSLEVPAGKEITIIASFVGYSKEKMVLKLNAGETKKLNFILKQTSTSISQVTIEDEMTRSRPLQRIDPKVITVLPGATGGVEAILKTLPGVSSNNELTSQYSVRGGNFDENLVYVNDIEIFRPLLIRAG
ncbi:MAG: carboxypeptidase-like regulatory domain-containing protein, partial [Bacteroidia bacterium]